MFYVVKKGDTLYSIAKKYGLTVDNLKDINNLSSNMLSIGQKLYLIRQSNPEGTYIVVKGDNLYSIAKRFDTTVDELKKLNNLSSDLLSIGQMIFLPEKEYYVVKKGDTLYSISQENNISIDNIKAINNLESDLLSVGQKLYFEYPNYETYIVLAGDTLYSIAKKYNTNISELIALNKLNTTDLMIGQSLLIP